VASLTVLYRHSSGKTEGRYEKCYSQYPAQDSNDMSPEYRCNALSVRQSASLPTFETSRPRGQQAQ
jgi:hypothetical protein